MASRRRNSPGTAACPKFIVSACLAGVNCTYNGKNKLKARIRDMVVEGLAVCVCPEMAGGAPLSRERCEISGGDGRGVLSGHARVKTVSGKDITRRMISGAENTLKIAKKSGVKLAIMKSKSPSCGRGMIYDGTFRGNLRRGDGVTTALLREHGIRVYNEKDIKLWPLKSIM
ncbi:MAG: DUF523 domain-containing protein [Candidatus Omnitrophota bacterium]